MGQRGSLKISSSFRQLEILPKTVVQHYNLLKIRPGYLFEEDIFLDDWKNENDVHVTQHLNLLHR